MKQRHFSMLRDFHLADWFTLANAFCGTSAVFASMRFLQDGNVRDLLVGMALIPLAVCSTPWMAASRAGARCPRFPVVNSIRWPT
jgi:hypothetical protein